MHTLKEDFESEFLFLVLSGPAEEHPSWPFPLEQPPDESFVEAKVRVSDLLEQAKQVSHISCSMYGTSN
jgi:hypothetical protein